MHHLHFNDASPLTSPPQWVQDFLRALEKGERRAASPTGVTDANGMPIWTVDLTVKDTILKILKEAPMKEMGRGFCDKAWVEPSLRGMTPETRIVPGGTAIRPGTFLGEKTVVMPPAYINIGAYVGSGTMIDSHALVGSCAQIGSMVHVSAGAQICGVLEPASARPVIIEDDAFVGAGAIVAEGFHVGKGAVLGAGVILAKSVPVFDVVHQRTYAHYIPPYAVVVPGMRPYKDTHGTQIHLASPIVVKYRDARTDAATALEYALRT